MPQLGQAPQTIPKSPQMDVFLPCASCNAQVTVKQRLLNSLPPPAPRAFLHTSALTVDAMKNMEICAQLLMVLPFLLTFHWLVEVTWHSLTSKNGGFLSCPQAVKSRKYLSTALKMTTEAFWLSQFQQGNHQEKVPYERGLKKGAKRKVVGPFSTKMSML